MYMYLVDTLNSVPESFGKDIDPEGEQTSRLFGGEWGTNSNSVGADETLLKVTACKMVNKFVWMDIQQKLSEEEVADSHQLGFRDYHIGKLPKACRDTIHNQRVMLVQGKERKEEILHL